MMMMSVHMHAHTHSLTITAAPPVPDDAVHNAVVMEIIGFNSFTVTITTNST